MRRRMVPSLCVANRTALITRRRVIVSCAVSARSHRRHAVVMPVRLDRVVPAAGGGSTDAGAAAAGAGGGDAKSAAGAGAGAGVQLSVTSAELPVKLVVYPKSSSEGVVMYIDNRFTECVTRVRKALNLTDKQSVKLYYRPFADDEVSRIKLTTDQEYGAYYNFLLHSASSERLLHAFVPVPGVSVVGGDAKSAAAGSAGSPEKAWPKLRITTSGIGGSAVGSPPLTPPLSPKSQQSQMSKSVMRRDGKRCVVTGSASNLQAVHVLGADPSQRLLHAGQEVNAELQQFLTPRDYEGKGKTVVIRGDRKELAVPFPDGIWYPYDVRLAVTMESKFNAMFAGGHAWVDAAGAIQFSKHIELTDSKTWQFRGTVLRKPSKPAQLAAWPTAGVWTLQRAIAPLLQQSRQYSAAPDKAADEDADDDDSPMPSPSAAAADGGGSGRARAGSTGSKPQRKPKTPCPDCEQPRRKHVRKECVNGFCKGCCVSGRGAKYCEFHNSTPADS